MRRSFIARGHLWLEQDQRDVATGREQSTDLCGATRRRYLARLEKVGITEDLSGCTSGMWALLWKTMGSHSSSKSVSTFYWYSSEYGVPALRMI